ncbi:hypothetical protein [Lysobacter sp. CA199]|uniref:hypothetical protein n=1 Tax=Lysobacter sp. CA199 TaxID=3455608 RepID=UPI003F8D5863
MTKLSTLEVDSPATVAAGAALWNKGLKNCLINGDFSIWQRGTSLAAGTGTRYLADRWFTGSVGTTVAPSRQSFAYGQTTVPGTPRYFHRAVVASAVGASNYALMGQSIEGADTLAGQSVTISFYAKADAARAIGVELFQSFGTGGSPSAAVVGIGATKLNLTTAWARYSLTVSVPSVSGKTAGTNLNDSLGLNFWFDAGSTFNSRSGALGQQSGTFDIGPVQVETGKAATAFEWRPQCLEMLLARRYFAMGRYASDFYTSSGSYQSARVPFGGVMRAAPTLAATFSYTLNTNTGAADNPTVDSLRVGVFATATGNCAFVVDWTADAEL